MVLPYQEDNTEVQVGLVKEDSLLGESGKRRTALEETGHGLNQGLQG